MCSYLIHETDTAIDDGKYKYDPADVVANFDFPAFMDSIRSGVAEAKDKKKHKQYIDDEILQAIMDNKIPRIKIGTHVDDLTRLKHAKLIEEAYRIRDEKLMKEVDRDMDVMYFTGGSGTGKTTFAKMLAKQYGYDCFVAGSSNDPLQGYMGQECVVLDDIRGSDWKINDLLKMLDNNTNSLVKSRYSNKLLVDCKLMILTSVQSISGLYKNMADHDAEPIEQLKRRCQVVLGFEKDQIYKFHYDGDNYISDGAMPNPVPLLGYVAKNSKQLYKAIDDMVSVVAVGAPDDIDVNSLYNSDHDGDVIDDTGDFAHYCKQFYL